TMATRGDRSPASAPELTGASLSPARPTSHRGLALSAHRPPLLPGPTASGLSDRRALSEDELDGRPEEPEGVPELVLEVAAGAEVDRSGLAGEEEHRRGGGTRVRRIQ